MIEDKAYEAALDLLKQKDLVIAKMGGALKLNSKEKAWRDMGHQCESRQRLEAIVQRSEEALTPEVLRIMEEQDKNV